MGKRKTDAQWSGGESYTLYLPLQTKCCVTSYSTPPDRRRSLTSPSPKPVPAPRLCCRAITHKLYSPQYSALQEGMHISTVGQWRQCFLTANQREEAGRKCVCETGSSTFSTEGAYINSGGVMDEHDTMNSVNLERVFSSTRLWIGWAYIPLRPKSHCCHAPYLVP